MSSANRECPECAKLGHDSNSDHLFMLKDGTAWFCNKDYHPPYLEPIDGASKGDNMTADRGPPKDSNKYAHRISVRDIAKLPLIADEDRMISKEVQEKLRVRTEYSETDRTPRAKYYPEFIDGNFIGFKCRDLPKFFISVHKEHTYSGSVDFFGQVICPRSGKKLLITAGEEDYLAAYQMLTDKYPEYDPCVIGLPRGEATSINTVADRLDFLSGFEEVIVAMDMDEAGRDALSKVMPLLGEGAKHLVLSENDISDMLTKGKAKEFINAYWSAKEYRPANIVDVSDILQSAIQPVKWGLSYPWEGLTKLTYGLKDVGEIIGVGAAPGAGKSTLWQMIQKHLLHEHREEIAIFDIEEGAEMGLKKLIGSCMNLPIHKPDTIYDIAKAEEIGKTFDGLAHFYGGDSEDWGEVESAIRYYASKGVRYMFVDPLSALVEHLSASEANQELGKIMRSMRKMRKHQGITFFHANHLNNPNTGKEHGEGGKVRGSQFSGSRAQWKYSTLLLGIERNQYADDPDDVNSMILRVLKDRLGGNTGFVDLKYDTDTGILNESFLEEM
jgi:twinkle protein